MNIFKNSKSIRCFTAVSAAAMLIGATLAVVPATSASANSGTVVVGLSAPISGAYSVFGTDFKATVDTEAALINKSGGVLGRNIKVDSIDDAASPQQGVLTAQSLVGSNPTPAMIIPDVFSAVSEAEFPVTTQAHMLTFSSCTAPACLNSNRFPYEYQLALPATEQDLAVIAGIAQVMKGTKKIKIGLMNSDDATGQAALAVYPSEIREFKGMSVAGSQLFVSGATSMSIEISKLRSDGANVLEYQGGTPTDFSTFVTGVAALGWSVPIIAGTQAVSSQFGSISAPASVLAKVYAVTPRVGVRSGASASTISTDPFVRAFIKADPNPQNWLPIEMMHDILLWWSWAANKAHSTQLSKVTAVLNSVGKLPASSLPTGLIGLNNPGWSKYNHSSNKGDFASSFGLIHPSKDIYGTYVGVPLELKP
jgi:branched-chain amino acid transport system substrate-binding protein